MTQPDYLQINACMIRWQSYADVKALLVLQVRYLKVIEKSGYQALPWVRYITTGGEYEIRMA